MRQISPVCKMADSGGLSIDQKVKGVLFYAETKSVVATHRRFLAHFGTRWAPCKQTIYRLSIGTIFQPMGINSVPDIKYFCKNKSVLCVQSMVWHFVRHPVLMTTEEQIYSLTETSVNFIILLQYGEVYDGCRDGMSNVCLLKGVFRGK